MRTRPWTKRREEELLVPFGDWLYEQSHLSANLDRLTPSITRQYAAAVGLSDDDQEDLDTTLCKLLLWAEIRGFVKTNPFSILLAA